MCEEFQICHPTMFMYSLYTQQIQGTIFHLLCQFKQLRNTVLNQLWPPANSVCRSDFLVCETGTRTRRWLVQGAAPRLP